jgi:hypothetical protein
VQSGLVNGSLLAIKFQHLYNRPSRWAISRLLNKAAKEGSQGWQKGGIMEFVMFEDVEGLEVFVNPERVIWVREYHNQTTEISCGHDDKFTVRLAPAHAVAALGKAAR